MVSRIWSAFGRVADAANAVADSLFNLSRSFQQADDAVRQRLELPALPAPALAPEQITGPMAQPEPEAPAVEPSGKNGQGRRSKSTASA